MIPFGKVDVKIDPQPLMEQLRAHQELWGQQAARIRDGSPHSATTDIWLRYRDPDAYYRQHGLNMAHFCDEHVSVWLPPAVPLSQGVSLARYLAGDRRLGGVLLTCTPPGCRIEPHIDHGWHAEVHDKLYVALQVRPGAEFCWHDGTIRATDGDVYWFRNDLTHWVVNNSDVDRIGMIVCLRK